MIKILSVFYSVFQFLNASVFWGRHPSSVPDNSIIFLPYINDRLFCGLIGVLEYKRKTKVKKEDYNSGFLKIEKSWEKLSKNGINAVIKKEVGADDYFKGEEHLLEFRDNIIWLKGINAFENIFLDKDIQKRISLLVNKMRVFILEEDSLLDKYGTTISSSSLERINRHRILLKDCLWWLEKELLLNLDKVESLIGASGAKLTDDVLRQLAREMLKINIVLDNIDRLEVRGRDSAGISIMIRFNNTISLDSWEEILREKGLNKTYNDRVWIKDFIDKKIIRKDSFLYFCYKIAKKLGSLGDNVSFLRNEIRNDTILHLALSYPSIYSQILAHTRWASVGEITEVNCHPLNNSCDEKDVITANQINVVLNGDIDNYNELKKRLKDEDRVIIPPHITTDTKIIPLWVEHYLHKGYKIREAFRMAVSDFKGSHAIALHSDLDPGCLFLAQRGSGQAIFIGIAQDSFVAASEVYGIVDQTPYYIKLNGEEERIPGEEKTKGQIYILDSKGGASDGLSACYYDGFPIDIKNVPIKVAQITTRDIDRQNFPHYYLKEINESPESVKKTIRGKVLVKIHDGIKQVTFNLGEEILPAMIEEAIASGKIKHIYLVGQGTAGIAAEGIAMLMSKYLQNAPVTIRATKASELSGFGLNLSLADTLVIAVTQSGTTTDTNKAIDLVRDFGAYTMAIVNRRDSDVTTKVDGVFYTSDGRDIEMSVASTKAFYAQIVAGCILGLKIAQLLGTKSDGFITNELRELKRLPKLMKKIIKDQSNLLRSSASSLALLKQNWSVVGSGPNKIAANEIRIKLSELCYKTLPADVVEDRKHIDLSAEPLIVLCAAGNNETVLGDIIKDTAIFKAHQATVVCFATEGEERFNGIADSISYLPAINERMAPILNTIAGHLWGYYAAKAINDEAEFFHHFKDSMNKKRCEIDCYDNKEINLLYDPDMLMLIKRFSEDVMLKKEARRYDGTVKPHTLCNLVLACKYATGQITINHMQNDFGDETRCYDPVINLSLKVDEIADQLSRPIDAIKHQAKTVTVGTSRLPITLSGLLFDMVTKLGFKQTDINPQVVLTLKNLQPAIKQVNGASLYHITGLGPLGIPNESSQIHIVERHGIAAQMHSRVENDHTLRGTKRTVIKNSEVFLGRGLWDNALIIIFPLSGKRVDEQYIIVLHISFFESLPLDTKIKAMGLKYEEVFDIVTEWNITWDDKLLEEFSPEYLLTESEEAIAQKIKAKTQSFDIKA